MSEAGLAGYDVDQWYVLLVPSKTPKEAVDKLNAAFVQALKKPEVIEKMGKQGFAAATSTPAQADALVKSDIDRWGKLVKQINLKVD